MGSNIEAKKYDSKFYESQMDGSYRSALYVLPIIHEILAPNSVLDIGCGVGSWLAAWKEINPTIKVLGIDGEYVNKDQLYISAKEFVAKDLKTEFQLNQNFDLVMSLEVGEHIPTELSETLVRNLVSHGKFVLFSAAIPYQQGTFHINEQFPEFWADIFFKYDFHPIDIIRNRIWDNINIEWWYRQNIILFVHSSELSSSEEIRKGKELTEPKALSRIHPQLWMYLNLDIQKSTKSILSFIRWKLAPLKKKLLR